MFTWQRRAVGSYEVSSRGDKRFSALHAKLPDGRSIEQHYQLDDCPIGKGYDPGGLVWMLGKGKPPLDSNMDLWQAYINLWRIWAVNNLPLLRELYTLAQPSCILSDCFATTPVNQAHALSDILNDLVKYKGYPPWMKHIPISSSDKPSVIY
jgi:hypothetical protein